MKFIHLCVILLLAGIIAAEVVQFNKCEDEDSVCEVKEVRVNPCTEAKSGSKNKPCKFKSGTNSSIEFDFIPHFDSTNLVNQAYSASFVDLPLLGMDRNGCKYTTCPLKSGESTTYRNVIFMSPVFPLLNYNVKWRLWDAKNDQKGCCFTFKIKLTA